MASKMLTQEFLKEVLCYDEFTGYFIWLKSHQKIKSGMRAGSVSESYSGKKYIRIAISSKRYLAHRLAFLYMTGNFPHDDVDHISGDGTDNRWANLSHATRTQNGRNQRLFSTNTSGVMGVSWYKRYGKWCAKIGIDGKDICLGYFDKLEDAAAARKEAEIKYGFHKNHGEVRPL